MKRGALWPAAIRTALSQCKWMLIVVSHNSAGSEWVRLEVDMAMALGHMRGRIIPVCLDDTDLRRVNEFLVSMQIVDARTTPLLAKTVADLIGAEVRRG